MNTCMVRTIRENTLRQDPERPYVSPQRRIDELEKEQDQAKRYLGELLLAVYPELHLLDDLYGLCMQVDNGLVVALKQMKKES